MTVVLPDGGVNALSGLQGARCRPGKRSATGHYALSGKKRFTPAATTMPRRERRWNRHVTPYEPAFRIRRQKQTV